MNSNHWRRGRGIQGLKLFPLTNRSSPEKNSIHPLPPPPQKNSYLNGNVEAMGKVLRRFHETTDDVQRLRRQV